MAPSLASSVGTVVGFIDIGTYSVRLLIARLSPNRSYTILNEQKESARLGSGEIFEQRLEQEAMQRTAMICARFAQMARSFGAQHIVAAATAATRDATNRRQFIRLLRKEANIDVRIVSGKEEARLIYLGVSRGMHLGDRRALFIDIGGGSTEVIVGDEREYRFLSSLPIGSIRLSQTFGLNTPDKPISPSRYTRVTRYVRSVAVRTIQDVNAIGFDVCVGSSGTLINLAEVAARKFPDRVAGPDLVLRRTDLREVAQMLCALPLEARRAVPGINPNRADIIIGGAALIQTLMEELNIEQMTLSKYGLRDGLLEDFMTRNNLAAFEEDATTRRRSALLLARRCGFDEQHAHHVIRLAVQLFDSALALGLHTYGSRERELLEYAGLLHDIGAFLSYESHEAHTYYLIKNADLVGFDQTEVSIIAAIARYHRKGQPRKRHEEVADLDEKQRLLVHRLGVLLRIAESLDRSHRGVVRGARLGHVDSRTAVLEPVAQGDCALEMWRVQKHKGAFKKAFGRSLVINLAMALDETTKPQPANQRLQPETASPRSGK